MSDFNLNAEFGGRAYPADPHNQCDGMTLLDWFAGKALENYELYPTNRYVGKDTRERTNAQIAAECYDVATCLLAEREKRVAAAKAAWNRREKSR